MAYIEDIDFSIPGLGSATWETNIPIVRDTELDQVDILVSVDSGAGDLTFVREQVTSTLKLNVQVTNNGVAVCSGRARVSLRHSIDR